MCSCFSVFFFIYFPLFATHQCKAPKKPSTPSFWHPLHRVLLFSDAPYGLRHTLSRKCLTVSEPFPVGGELWDKKPKHIKCWSPVSFPLQKDNTAISKTTLRWNVNKITHRPQNGCTEKSFIFTAFLMHQFGSGHRDGTSFVPFFSSSHTVSSQSCVSHGNKKLAIENKINNCRVYHGDFVPVVLFFFLAVKF